MAARPAAWVAPRVMWGNINKYLYTTHIENLLLHTYQRLVYLCMCYSALHAFMNIQFCVHYLQFPNMKLQVMCTKHYICGYVFEFTFFFNVRFSGCKVHNVLFLYLSLNVLLSFYIYILKPTIILFLLSFFLLFSAAVLGSPTRVRRVPRVIPRKYFVLLLFYSNHSWKKSRHKKKESKNKKKIKN